MEKIVKAEAEWRAGLSELAYKVTRKHATERAGSHEEFADGPGVFSCVCCGAELFDKAHKYDSGTGWPSFFQPKDADMIGERADNSLFARRTEVICNRCDAHLGHVFADGPQPTGQRYCINGVALEFTPETDKD